MSRADHSKPTAEELQRQQLDAAKAQVSALIAELPLKEAGEILLAATNAMLAKTNNYSPIGSRLMRLESNDKGDGPEHLVVTFARGKTARLLSAAYDAVKTALGV